MVKIARLLKRAERDLPSQVEDQRWGTALALKDELVYEHPLELWSVVARWGASPDEDLRDAVACCILEHLLEYHFDLIFPLVEQKALLDPLFADMFRRCWKLGQSELPENAARFDALVRESPRPTTALKLTRPITPE